MKLLTLTEQHTLHHRYKLDDLYRQWSPILSMLQRKYNEADAQTLWYQAVRQIIRLRGEQSYRDQEIAPIYNELLTDGLSLDKTARSKEQAQRTATTVMCIVLTMLMNAVEKGHEDESFDNEPVCMAIMDILSGDVYFQSLMNLFFKRNIGYDGNKVIITPSDPMLETTLPESMDEVGKEEINQMVENVMSRTKGLQALFGDGWAKWKPLWCEILTDTEFMLLLKNQEPRGTEWDINQKMVCNVVGLIKAKTKMKASFQALNDAICTKNMRSYFSNIADFEGTDCVFSREQSDRLRQLIEKLFLSTESK